MMAKAVFQNPNNLAARFERAIINKNIPDFLGQGGLAKSDFNYIIEKLEDLLRTTDNSNKLRIQSMLDVVKKIATED